MVTVSASEIKLNDIKPGDVVCFKGKYPPIWSGETLIRDKSGILFLIVDFHNRPGFKNPIDYRVETDFVAIHLSTMEKGYLSLFKGEVEFII